MKRGGDLKREGIRSSRTRTRSRSKSRTRGERRSKQNDRLDKIQVKRSDADTCSVTNGKVLLSDISLYCQQSKAEGLVTKDGDTLVCCPVGPHGSILASAGDWSPTAVYLC